ncbi:MAG: hypothetical protein LLH30_02960 [Candidatus Manganitrophus sp. SA1]|nr:hypothetical protein [Candidatus Manganitrophus morganii]MCG3114619.1 hypothetical protein [Candidatus Manganitrophus morganii]
MTQEQKEEFERFVFRHANLTLIDYALGHDIFDKVVQQRLNRLEKNYFLTLAEAEEAELVEARKTAPSEATRMKIDRLLKNAREVREILKE